MILRAGTYLQNRYEIIERIGSGGMSDVYKACCHKLNRLVAIKVLKEEFCEDESFVSKFKMEAQAAAGLSHPNIVNVYDVVDEGDLHYIVMELIEGITLKNYILKRGKLDIKESIGISIQVAQGISAAHARHIIHRDIKPQNMIISKEGKVKVADFGIARAASAQTLSSVAMGSVHYISPEQAKGAYMDERSDIYSLGITMYEMLTGKLPFNGENTVSIALAHIEESITAPSIYNHDIPVALEKIVLKCTQKKVENRYQNVLEVITDLRKVLVNLDNIIEDMDQDDMDQDDDGKTRIISPEEIDIIKSGHKGIERLSNQYSGKNRKSQLNKETEKLLNEDGTDPKIDKMMSIAGSIIALVLVLIVVVVIGIKLDIFNFSKKAMATQSNINESESISDTQIYMPDVTNMDQDLAEAKLKEDTLQIYVEGSEYSDTIAKNYVISQVPAAGEVASKYSKVNVIISKGSDKTDLTKLGLESLTAEDAKIALEKLGFKVTLVYEYSDTIAADKLIKYDPSIATVGETILVYVSKGKDSNLVKVPNIINQSENSAIGMLTDLGLVVGTVTKVNSDTVTEGYVVSQSILSDTEVITGTVVNYTISTGTAADYNTSSGQSDTDKSYVASINTTYNLSDLIGPGSSATSIEIMVRLKQQVAGETVYTTLMEPRTVTGDTILPVRFKTIEGANGVEQGQVEVVNASSTEVLKSYDVEFFAVD